MSLFPSRVLVACLRCGGLQSLNTISELDAVILTCDLPTHGLVRGDVGTAVLVHGAGVAFEVEFVRQDGRTVALLTLERSQVRPQRQDGERVQTVRP